MHEVCLQPTIYSSVLEFYLSDLLFNKLANVYLTHFLKFASSCDVGFMQHDYCVLEFVVHPDVTCAVRVILFSIIHYWSYCGALCSRIQTPRSPS